MIKITNKLKLSSVNRSVINVVATIATLALLSSQAAMAAQGHLKVTSKVQKMVMVTKADGNKAYNFLPATKVLPGEMLQYNTYYENIGNQAADNINIVNPIPKHLIYLPNSAQGKNTDIVFSVDGGKNYGKAGTLKVRGSDGNLYPAQPSNYTHIKWQYLGNLAPKTKQAVAYRARLQ